MSEFEKGRTEFEAWLGKNPSPLLWNTSDAMFAAWQAARAERAEAAQPSEQAQLLVLARIREAVGDSHARLMHDELVERIRGLCAEAAQRVPPMQGDAA